MNRIVIGDSFEVLKTLAANSFDAAVTDPPYHLTEGKRGGIGPASLNLNSPAGRARISTGFMGKSWDGGDIAFRTEFWSEVIRVLKPGSHLVAFGATRTHHRMVCAIEDAGFEIRDEIDWVFGSGFPKSSNQEGEWDGWGTALKPAKEPICLARKPLIGTVPENLSEHRTGALNIYACLVGMSESIDIGRWPANLIHDGSPEVVAQFPAEAGAAAPVHVRNGDKFRNVYGEFRGNRDEKGSTFHGDAGSAARFFGQFKLEDDEWIHQHLGLIVAPSARRTLSLQNEHVVSALNDAVTSVLPAGMRSSVSKAPSTPVTAKELRQIATSAIGAIHYFAPRFLLGQQHESETQTHDRVSVVASRTQTGTMTITVSRWRSDGSAAPVTFSITATNSGHGERDCDRFKYCAKASQKDREAGLEFLRQATVTDGRAITNDTAYQRGATLRRNTHPTVKPTELMRWLCRLITPKGGHIIDPFFGSGSTGRGAVLEGFTFTGIERETEYVPIAHARVAEAAGEMFAQIEIQNHIP